MCMHMCMCMCVYEHVHVYVNTSKCMCMCICVCMNMYEDMRMCMFMHTFVCACTYVQMCISTCVGEYVCKFMCVCILYACMWRVDNTQTYLISLQWPLCMKQNRATSFVFIHQTRVLKMRHQCIFSLYSCICNTRNFLAVEFFPFFSVECLNKVVWQK
jgi:hypothetical protein